MTKKLFMYGALLCVLLMQSCLSDEISDLKKDIAETEQVLGVNNPLDVNFATTYDDGTPLTLSKKYTLSNQVTDNGIEKQDEGDIYDIWVNKMSDLSAYDWTWLSFRYNATTKEISLIEAQVQFRNKYGEKEQGNFYHYNDFTTLSVKINSIDVESGEVDLVLNGQTTSAASANIYENKPMTITMKFKGQLAKIQ